MFKRRWDNLIKYPPRGPMEKIAREMGLDPLNLEHRPALTREWFRRATRERPELLTRGLAKDIVTTWKDGLRNVRAAQGHATQDEAALEAEALGLLYGNRPEHDSSTDLSAVRPLEASASASIAAKSEAPKPSVSAPQPSHSGGDQVDIIDANGLKDYYRPKSNNSIGRVAGALADLPFRAAGGIAAGNNEVVQYEYQKKPFTPVNWMFKYTDPPKQEDALAWTNAQLAFNDALEAGLVVKNSRSLGRFEPVTIKLMEPKGDGTPGMAWVFEPGQKDPDKPRDRYQLETPMVSDIETRQTWVPALGYRNPNTNGHNFVRYDAVDQANYIVYDRKWNTTGHRKQFDDMKRQILSLMQNPDWTLIVEVPTKEVQKRRQTDIGKL